VRERERGVGGRGVGGGAILCFRAHHLAARSYACHLRDQTPCSETSMPRLSADICRERVYPAHIPRAPGGQFVSLISRQSQGKPSVVELQGLPTLFPGSSASTRKRPTKLWSGSKPQSGLEREFLDTAERARIETAIRLAAEELDKEKVAKARFIQEHDDAVKREEKDESEAKMLHAKAVSLAQRAIDQRTTYHVELDRAGTAEKEMALDKRIASLMAEKSETLKGQAQQNSKMAHEAAEQASHLKHSILQLERQARAKGEHANAIVESAQQLLASARTMSEKAEAEDATEKEQTKNMPLLSRLNEHKKLEQEAMQHDLNELARAQLKVKQLTGVEGIDEASRAAEGVQDVQKSIASLQAQKSGA